MWPHNSDADHLTPRILGGKDGPLRWFCRACSRSRGGEPREHAQKGAESRRQGTATCTQANGTKAGPQLALRVF